MYVCMKNCWTHFHKISHLQYSLQFVQSCQLHYTSHNINTKLLLLSSARVTGVTLAERSATSEIFVTVAEGKSETCS